MVIIKINKKEKEGSFLNISNVRGDIHTKVTTRNVISTFHPS